MIILLVLLTFLVADIIIGIPAIYWIITVHNIDKKEYDKGIVQCKEPIPSKYSCNYSTFGLGGMLQGQLGNMSSMLQNQQGMWGDYQQHAMGQQQMYHPFGVNTNDELLGELMRMLVGKQ